MSLRFDSTPIASHEKLPDGRLRVRASFSRVGSLRYMKADGSYQDEIVTAEELFREDSLQSAALAPVTLGHPSEGMITPANFRKYAVGSTGSKVVGRKDAGLVEVVMVLNDADAIEAVESGKARQVSAGYTTNVERGDDGNLYQKNRYYNHVALCSIGRAGSDVRVHFDSVDDKDCAVQVAEFESPTPTPQVSVSAPPPVHTTPKNDMGTEQTAIPQLNLRVDEDNTFKLPLDAHAAISAKFKADQATIADLQKQLESAKGGNPEVKAKADTADTLTAKLDEAGFESVDALLTELQTQTDRADAAEAARDQAKEDLDKAKEQKSDAAEIDSRVNARLALIHQVAPLLPKDFKFDGLSDRQLREAVITGNTTVKADALVEKSDSYVEARFDAVIESATAKADEKSEPDELDRVAVGASAGRVDSADPESRTDAMDREKMRKRLEERIMNRGKKKKEMEMMK